MWGARSSAAKRQQGPQTDLLPVDVVASSNGRATGAASRASASPCIQSVEGRFRFILREGSRLDKGSSQCRLGHLFLFSSILICQKASVLAINPLARLHKYSSPLSCPLIKDAPICSTL